MTSTRLRLSAATFSGPCSSKGEGQIELRQAGKVLLDPHHLVLRDGQQSGAVFFQSRNFDCRFVHLCLGRLIDAPGQCLDRTCFEERPDRQRHAEDICDPSENPSGEERMAAQIEEIVKDADFLDLK